MLKTAEAKGIEERSVVVKRLHVGSKCWGDKILERKKRLVFGSREVPEVLGDSRGFSWVLGGRDGRPHWPPLL